jgi:lysophospholipase L1-like esterase
VKEIARSGLVALALVLAATIGTARAAEGEGQCAAPSSVMALGRPLDHTGDRLLRGLPVTIVALGSSSTAGTGASDARHTYPSQLAQFLERRFPRSHVQVLNKGVGGEETGDMLRRLDRDVLAAKPDLVIWQIGSNELLHRSSLDDFRRNALDGLARLKAAGIETILMDAQYAPMILENSQYRAFNEAMRDIARSTRIALLDRFEAMRYWARGGHHELMEHVSPDRLHMNDAGYACVARLLTALIAADLPALASR